LSVVGVTSESKADTEPWVEEKEAAYPYAYDKGGKLSAALGVSGIPAAFLVNPKGIVVWKGHPSGLRAGIIEEHIKGARKTAPGIDGLTSNWPKSAASIKRLLAKNKIGQALVAARKLAEKDQEGEAVVETLSGLAQSEIDAVKELKEAGNILGALDTIKLARKTLAGSEKVKELDALAKEIKASKDASKIVKAQTQVAKLKSKGKDLRKKKDVVALIKKVNKLIAKNADNFAGQEAEKLKARLTKKMERMRR
jgi:AhpC/TSA family